MKTSCTLFVVIDIIGSIPFIIKTKRTAGKIQPGKTTLTAALIGLSFLFFGQEILNLFELEIASFQTAGGLVLFVLGIELLFDIEINKNTLAEGSFSSITPLGFPVIAGTGTLTQLLLLLKDYKMINVLAGFSLNLIVVYLVIRYVEWIEKLLGYVLITLLTRIMGLMLLTMGIQLVKEALK